MVILAIALAGLCPCMVMQMRILRRFESQPIENNPQVLRGVQLVDDEPYFPVRGDVSQPVLILLPQPDDWVRRLGGAATFELNATPQGFSRNLTETTLHREPGDDAPWTLLPVAPGRYRVMIHGSVPEGTMFTLTDGSTPPSSADAPAVGPGPWYDLGEHSLDVSLDLSLTRGANAAVVVSKVRIGARNDVTVLPPSGLDPPPAPGSVAVRVRVVTRP
ncbi:hypothetical protein [Paludisphaera mucosa]|uniref:Uncharacterized protein n=1 Tax=Paludisphaera mucosa TaxID=3030827 RepID=A0ABT6FJZ8_9BACT|nr:hypothetical protein [Paludisphaera mucosa]MDG3007705.1 hypothetical protein [Paludisphaera mucosa]